MPYFSDIMRIISSRKKRILEEIQKNPSHGYQLAKNLNISLSSVYEHLKDLRENGLIESKTDKDKKIYFLTEKGKHLLNAL